MENGPYKWVGFYIYNLVAGPFILKNLIASFSVCRETGMYSALKVIYCLLLLKSLLWGNIVYTMELIVEVVIWDKLILCPRPREISTNQMIVDFMGAGLNLHTPQTTLLLKQVLLLVWSRYSYSFLPSLSLIHVHLDLLFLSFHIILSQLVLKWINLFTLISLFFSLKFGFHQIFYISYYVSIFEKIKLDQKLSGMRFLIKYWFPIYTRGVTDVWQGWTYLTNNWQLTMNWCTYIRINNRWLYRNQICISVYFGNYLFYNFRVFCCWVFCYNSAGFLPRTKSWTEVWFIVHAFKRWTQWSWNHPTGRIYNCSNPFSDAYSCTEFWQFGTWFWQWS